MQHCTVYIVRHGQTEYNKQDIIQGHVDSPLTEAGIAQASELGKILSPIHFDAVYSSDLLRAHKTAEIITLSRNLEITTTELLRERNYGRFDGKPAEHYREESIKILSRMKELDRYEKRNLKFEPDIESDNEIADRLITFLKELSATYPGKTILVTTHGGLMRVFLNHLEWNGPTDLKSGSVKNTAYIKLITNGENFLIDEVTGVEKS